MGRKKGGKAKAADKLAEAPPAKKPFVPKLQGPVQLYKCFLFQNIRFSLNEVVEIRSSEGGVRYFGEITSVAAAERKQPDDIVLTMKWYYSPSDIGAEPWMGANELFESSHTDKCTVSSVERKINLMTLEEYEAATPNPLNFFSRLKYDHKKKKLVGLDAIPKYCICKQPHNPDLEMIQCDVCDDWMHTACVRVKAGELDGYTCPRCEE